MIVVRDLMYQYRTGKALHFPDFTLKKGDHGLLIGESGSGKTTLLHLLGGLLKAQAGSIEIDKTDIRKLSEPELDHFRGLKIGFVFQKNHLIQSLTVKSNLMLPPFLAGIKQNSEIIKKNLDRLGLIAYMDSAITELSQGQAQRVAIARSLMNNPLIIFADEPTSALDDKNCEHVINLLLDVAQEIGSTLLIATHDQRLKNKISNQLVLKNNNLTE